MTTIRLKIPILLDLLCVCPVLFYRLLKFGHTFRKIFLGENKFTIVDPLIFYRLNNYHWTIDGNGKSFYAVRTVLLANGKKKILRMHRDIMRPKSNILVDHRNSNGLDNRRANLRLATHAQNSYNCRKRNNTASKYIGVSFEKRRNYWYAQIMHKGKHKWLGRFKNEIEAARAYDRTALKLRGEFARLNFPELTAGTAESAKR